MLNNINPVKSNKNCKLYQLAQIFIEILSLYRNRMSVNMTLTFSFNFYKFLK